MVNPSKSMTDCGVFSPERKATAPNGAGLAHTLATFEDDGVVEGKTPSHTSGK